MSRRGLSLVAATIVLSGCASHGPTMISPRIKQGQSWLITRPVIAVQILDTCERDSPAHHPQQLSGYWAPSRQQIEQLEAHLEQLKPTISAPADADRQYVGIEADGQRLIYVNAFRLPDGSALDPGHDAVRDCDGGGSLWGAVYNPQIGEFSQIEISPAH